MSSPKITPPGSMEFTFRAVLLGCILGVLLTAAGIYFGLYAGMTVSASIPAAVISMGILRGVLRTGTVRENNIVQTIASAGESLAGGIIFTIPALVILGVWEDYQGLNFWYITFIAVLGGMLGVLFMVPLRRALIVEEEELIYPEGVACAEVLKTGEVGGSGVGYVFGALVVGAIFKFLISGLGMITSIVEGAWRWGRTAFYLGTDISPALLAVGYIIGLNVSFLVFVGGAIGWAICIPGCYLANGYPSGAESVLKTMYQTWEDQVRFIGVGSMIVGGMWSIISVRKGIFKGFQGAVAAYRNRHSKDAIARTDQDMDIRMILLLFLPTMVAIFFLYRVVVGSWAISLSAGVIMVASAFFFVAVSSYIVGLVGSSNNPVSGMTISTMLFASSLLLLFGFTGTAGTLAALCIAGVVCCAICTAGDVSQDLKTGYLVGATPRRQQWAQVIGILVPACVIAPVLSVLHIAYGIGVQAKEGVPFLKAPQASLFAEMSKAMFDDEGSLPWDMVWIGVGIGVLLIVIDEIQRVRGSRFRAYVMPVAVGIYLPWSIDVPILFGGLAVWFVERFARNKEEGKTAVHRGVLLSSGLIAGESLMGILIAILLVLGVEMPQLALVTPFQNGLSMGLMMALMLGLMVASRRVRK